jgi:NAD(P)-dependent dehydrogenase (short-subunit alcohol dehydrogenase family)
VTITESYGLRIIRDEDGRIRAIELRAHDLEGHERSVGVEGVRAAYIAGPMQEALRAAGIKGRQWSEPTPLRLSPILGAQVELLLRAVKPLRRIDRIATVAEGVAGMSQEESAYWHAQASRRHGLRALRVLLDGGKL